jgi:hypothetical protein
MSKRLIVLDIDQTICDSRSINVLLPVLGKTQEDYARWHQAIHDNDFPIIPGSLSRVRALAKNPKNIIVLLTARSETLFIPTAKWLAKHFPMLENCELNMRPSSDLSSSLDSKRVRLAKLKRKHRPSETLIIDDDITMSLLPRVFRKTKFFQIKDCTWTGIDPAAIGGFR